MGHKCYISFKTEDTAYKEAIQSWANKDKVDMIDKSLNTPIDSYDEDYIMRKIREDYLSDSTVTIFLIGEYSSESLGKEKQKYIIFTILLGVFLLCFLNKDILIVVYTGIK